MVMTNGSGGTMNLGDIVHVDTDGDVILADADSTATMPAFAICLEDSVFNGSTASFLLYGTMTDTAWNWTTVGGPLYVSTTAGDMSQLPPSGTGDISQKVGIALSADTIFFNPSPNYIVKK